ncbi:hypothetical protein EN873_40845 [bacterium M00.F.Ca.ET.230.01.1.1]|nr:hypothetical protein EN873_40845 [bacterium M00.F.Ca.ET.230.01.1.1]
MTQNFPVILDLAGRNLCVRSPQRGFSPSDAECIYPAIQHLELMYPRFRQWYFDLVAKEIESSTRRIFVSRTDERILGIALAKRGAEKKLCTLWIEPSARSSGLATSLAAEAFSWMGTNKPLFTVPEERMSEFRGLLTRWDFCETERLVGYYRKDKVEYVFNGKLKSTLAS